MFLFLSEHRRKIAPVQLQLKRINQTQGRIVSLVIVKEILNWKQDRTRHCQALEVFKRSIVVSKAALPELVFLAF